MMNMNEAVANVPKCCPEVKAADAAIISVFGDAGISSACVTFVDVHGHANCSTFFKLGGGADFLRQ